MKAFIMVGLIASGKSTFSLKQARDYGSLIINRDSIRTMLFGEYRYDVETEAIVRQIARSAVDSCVKADRDIVIDETNITKKKRGEWVSLLKELGCNDITIVWCSSNKGNVTRRMSDPRGVSEEQWMSVFNKMKADFEPISDDEGHNSIIHYEIPYGWIGVDLDGTLAEYDGWKGIEHIGAPVIPMVERVKGWIESGKCVKVFTSRACNGDEQIEIIYDWLEKVGLPRLDVTNVKDSGMIELWDDRCISVEKNTGRVK